jgi:hypothetical protein
MKTQNLLLTALLLLVSAASLAAQNTLPNPHDDTCWSSLSALRACQIQTYDQAQAQAQNCTSYPEYQCFDYYQPPQKNVAKTAPKADVNGTATTGATSGVTATSSIVQTSSAN